MDKKHYYSVFTNEQECLQAILDLHIKNETFELDPMFYKGGFYKEIPIPKLYGDLRGNELKISTWDATNLPFESHSIKNMILDPPFVIVTRKSQLKSQTTNFSYFTSLDELKETYLKLLKEAKRILTINGILVFKCQDYTDSKTIMSHCIVYNLATELGFYAKDLVILNNVKNKIANNQLQQRHFRKTHSYFWIFENKK